MKKERNYPKPVLTPGEVARRSGVAIRRRSGDRRDLDGLGQRLVPGGRRAQGRPGRDADDRDGRRRGEQDEGRGPAQSGSHTCTVLVPPQPAVRAV